MYQTERNSPQIVLEDCIAREVRGYSVPKQREIVHKYFWRIVKLWRSGDTEDTKTERNSPQIVLEDCC